MPNILIIESDTPNLIAQRHASGRRPDGLRYADVLREIDASVSSTICAPYAGEIPDFTTADGVVFTGSAVSWSVAEEPARPLRDAMEQAFAAGLPVYGSCNGMQVGAVVLGGEIGACEMGCEDGLARDIHRTSAGRTHPMLAGRRDGYTAICVHRDEVSRPPTGATVLSGNRHTNIQTFAYEKNGVRFWGSQYHPEYAPQFMAWYLPNVAARPNEQLQADLQILENDAQAATRHNTSMHEIGPYGRYTELRNWLHSLDRESVN